MEDEVLQLIKRRAALQRRLRRAEDAIAYSRVLLDIAQLNRQLAAASDQPAHRNLGFLRPIGESWEAESLQAESPDEADKSPEMA